MAPLRFPNHFPPTDRWGKFFIGVRWLGPDLSFFKLLKEQQAARKSNCMAAWGGGEREAIARRISSVLSQQLGWPAPFFIPEDSAQVAFHGPSFDWTDPESAFNAVVEALDCDHGIKPDDEFWRSLNQVNVTMGQLVAALQATKAT